MLAVTDLKNYDPSYDGYAFFQTSTITDDDITAIACTPKNYLKKAQGYTPSTQYKAGKSAESFNQLNLSLPVWYFLLYNQSTVDVFRNTSLLAKNHQSGRNLHLIWNYGTVPITLVGDIEGYGTVWNHTKGINNTLSLAWAINIYRITYNSKKGNSFKVNKEDGITRRFVESTQGLYWLNTKDAYITALLNVYDKSNK